MLVYIFYFNKLFLSKSPFFLALLFTSCNGSKSAENHFRQGTRIAIAEEDTNRVKTEVVEEEFICNGAYTVTEEQTLIEKYEYTFRW